MKRRTTYAVLAWLLGVLGVVAVALGAIVALMFGQQGQLRSAPSRLDGPGAAIVLEQVRVDATNIPVPAGIGTLTIDVTPVGPNALFVGTAQPESLDAYLRGAPYDVVTDLVPGGTATIRSVPGTALPGPPQSAGTWTASVTGAPGKPVSLHADLTGNPSLAVTNATPANGVVADMTVTLTVGWAWTAAMALLAGGAAALVLCGLLAWRSRVAGRRARAANSAHRAGQPGADGAAGATVLPGTAPVGPPASGDGGPDERDG